MAKEVVITSVPRGIKLGRTGFQVVMRTAGTGDGVLSSLEQLGGYRHVHPQGSGSNPLIYSYRVVRGNTGQLNVLGRTVDAGNDFSNRSNKLAHLLAIHPGELSALRNSSPAAVLAAIDGKLATAWPGGPEERPSPFALPAPPIQPAACRRWNDVKGDAGWGGLLAQRAMRGQATLVIAPDCSPTWSRRLLDLFQEVLALLPSDSRWKTTFETTVIGSTSSMLRGTYAGSPESAAGHAGLLVVDLSQRAALPANVAPDELIKIAREGQRQAFPGKAPPIPSGSGAATLPPNEFETSPMPTIGVQPAGPSGPSRAPVAWDDDEETASPSRLGWYIGGGIVLLGLLLVSALVGGWSWFDDFTTKKLRQRFSGYAKITDGNEPKTGEETPPAVADWRRAYRDDKASIDIPDAAFPILLSALRTERVDESTIQDTNARQALVAAVRALSDLKENDANLLNNAKTLGLVIPEDLQDHDRKAIAFLSGWLASDAGTPGKATPFQDFDSLQKKIDLTNKFISAAFGGSDHATRTTGLSDLVPRIWPGLPGNEAPNEWVDEFAKNLKSTKADFKAVKGVLDDATKPTPPNTPGKEDSTPSVNQGDKAVLAQKAFLTLCESLLNYVPKHPKDCTEVDLAKGLDTANLRLKIELPSCGTWKPKTEPDPKDNPTTWKLKGLPDDPTIEWGTIVLDDEASTLKFTLQHPRLPDSHDPLYVPIRFVCAGSPDKSKSIVIAATEKTTFQRTPDKSLFSLMESGTLTLQTNEPVESSAALNNYLTTQLVNQKISGLQLTPENPNVPGVSVSVIALKLKEVETQMSDVWLDSFNATAFLDPNNRLALRVNRNTPGPWSKRGSRLGKLTPSPLPQNKCDQEEWEGIVKAILDASPHMELHGSKGKKAVPIVVQWLGGKPDDFDKKKTFDTEVNNLTSKGVAAWRDKAAAYLFKDSSDYSIFTSVKATQKMGFGRPRDYCEPLRPSKGATPEEVAALNQKRDAWEENNRKVKLWIAEFERLHYSSQNVVAFLTLAPNEPLSDQSIACRAAAVVVLELAAKQAAETASNAMATASLGSLFSVTLALPWVFEDGTKESVDRLTIQPAAGENPAQVTTPSLPQTRNIGPPKRDDSEQPAIEQSL